VVTGFPDFRRGLTNFASSTSDDIQAIADFMEELDENKNMKINKIKNDDDENRS